MKHTSINSRNNYILVTFKGSLIVKFQIIILKSRTIELVAGYLHMYRGLGVGSFTLHRYDDMESLEYNKTIEHYSNSYILNIYVNIKQNNKYKKNGFNQHSSPYHKTNGHCNIK